ncbi:lipase chaperone [Nocardia seriolae]|uniref:Catechol 1,2-dioxygenase n=1 Tax=Nocardia seriolae TaxID=37332 RepID=A0A0B8NLG1_9NOCA|nr:lipase chaperone [Nocardia seriolae]MTJ64526.1 lipase chaperone [Nocardia seriolae]MTJ74588.1 lipase chaperone [Nocardia seriolae]MTJ89370.1 lipase chaperone [Nocardia seriolae]MTK42482.1 lipase chaperone [Nocardia seriolae]MTK49938.1 lipase chaperone [Nocardia seriolae]
MEEDAVKQDAGNGHERHEHDLGLGHDLRVMNRRRALWAVGAAGVAAVAAGWSTSSSGSSASSTTATASATAAGTAAAAPQETAGPYPGDGSNGPNVLIESGVVRSDITISFGAYSGVAKGVPMNLTLDLRDLTKSGAAGAGMAVYVWHCDRDGNYSLYSSGVTEQNYLRGVQVADTDGIVSFTSIFPACYSGRWPHIHFEVYDTLSSAVAGENARLTSQIALPQEVCKSVYDYDSGYSRSISNMSGVSLASDNVFGDGWDAELATVTGTPADGLQVRLRVGVGAKSQNTQSGNGPGQQGGGKGPGGTPPGGTPPSGLPPRP